MAWPNTVASKITALFFKLKYQDSIKVLLNEEILVKEMNFFPLEGSPEVKEKKAILVAGELLKFMDGLNIQMEPDGDRSLALKELVLVMKDGEKQSSEISVVINTHFKFKDEE